MQTFIKIHTCAQASVPRALCVKKHSCVHTSLLLMGRVNNTGWAVCIIDSINVTFHLTWVILSTPFSLYTGWWIPDPWPTGLKKYFDIMLGQLKSGAKIMRVLKQPKVYTILKFYTRNTFWQSFTRCAKLHTCNRGKQAVTTVTTSVRHKLSSSA